MIFQHSFAASNDTFGGLSAAESTGQVPEMLFEYFQDVHSD